MIELIEFNGRTYPKLQSAGHAARWCSMFAMEIFKDCSRVVDVGCHKPEWALPGAIPVDIAFDDPYEALNLPEGKLDGIFSSHCLEHLPNYVDALEYWYSRLEPGGILFLYLPHPDQEYWKPHHNRKHIHSLNPDLLREILEDLGYVNIFITGYDLNHSFYVIAERKNDSPTIPRGTSIPVPRQQFVHKKTAAVVTCYERPIELKECLDSLKTAA